MSQTDEGADSPQPVEAAVTFYFIYFFRFFWLFKTQSEEEDEEEEKKTSLFRILLLLRASSHFHPFPPSPTPDSSLYRCSHKSHNAPVIITPTPVYLQPVAWRGASLSLSLSLSTSLSPPPLLLCFPSSFSSSCPFSFFFSPSLVISFLLHLSPVTPSSRLYPAVSSLYCNSCFLLFVLSCLYPHFEPREQLD